MVRKIEFGTFGGAYRALQDRWWGGWGNASIGQDGAQGKVEHGRKGRFRQPRCVGRSCIDGQGAGIEVKG